MVEGERERGERAVVGCACGCVVEVSPKRQRLTSKIHISIDTQNLFANQVRTEECLSTILPTKNHETDTGIVAAIVHLHIFSLALSSHLPSYLLLVL